MANYRFKAAEIEAMKKNILTHIEHEAETKTAWRLRCAIEGQLMCCRPSKREAARLERELALYEKLTKNDLPNWQSEPTQPATPTETPRISTEAAETVNVSAEGEKAAETKEMQRCECPNYADYAFERGWSIENTDFDPHSGILCMIHFDPSDEKYVCGCLWQINSDKPNYTEHRRFKTLKGAQNYGTKRMGMKLEYQTLTVNCSVTPSEPPHSPETPQIVECIADTPKPRETARKPQNRGIGSAQHHQCSALGANGYAVLNDASTTMAAMNVRCDTLRDTLRSVTHVPRECSTVDAAHW